MVDPSGALYVFVLFMFFSPLFVLLFVVMVERLRQTAECVYNYFTKKRKQRYFLENTCKINALIYDAEPAAWLVQLSYGPHHRVHSVRAFNRRVSRDP